MDIDVAVILMRTHAAALLALIEQDRTPGQDVDHDAAIESHSLALIEATQAVDDWMGKGGFRPKVWQQRAALPVVRGRTVTPHPDAMSVD
jgi:hypothetical protein